MIRKLKGIIDTIDINSVIIDVGGVGYNAFCSSNTLRQLPQKGEAATLHIETHVREDHIHLYGFFDAVDEQQRSFRVGPLATDVTSKEASHSLHLRKEMLSFPNATWDHR